MQPGKPKGSIQQSTPFAQICCSDMACSQSGWFGQTVLSAHRFSLISLFLFGAAVLGSGHSIRHLQTVQSPLAERITPTAGNPTERCGELVPRQGSYEQLIHIHSRTLKTTRPFNCFHRDLSIQVRLSIQSPQGCDLY